VLVDAPFNRITGEVIAAAIEVHRILGPGLLESTYIPCLQYELSARKLRYVTQQPLPLVYKGMVLNATYRLDLVVEETVVVEVKVKEGDRERVQAYEGVVIAKSNRGLNSSFTVRKISHGEGVERVFQSYSPALGAITVKRRGNVRRAKLYFLRERTGKSARIEEKV